MSKNRLRLAALLAVLAGVATACAKRAPQDILRPDGPVARDEDRLWDITFPIAILVFFLVMGLILYAIIRFRAKGDDDAPVQVHGNTKLEIGWTIVPALLLLVVGILTVGTVIQINRRPVGDDVLSVKVIGHQWWWEYQYPDSGVVTANELHIPVNTKIDVTLQSKDVIHSFWPPKLAGKVDVIPGRTNRMVIEADKAGKTYYGQCAEFCGLSHANMRLRVVTHSPQSFKRWVADQQQASGIPTSGEAAAGAQLFRNKGCGGCHTVKGITAGKVGPDLTHLQSRKVFAGAIFDLNEGNLRRWLADPVKEKPMMPGKGLGMPNLNLTDNEITSLIAYLNTLK